MTDTMNHLVLCHLALLLTIALPVRAGKFKSIAAGDPNIRIDGALFATPAEGGVEVLRFPPALFDLGYNKLRANPPRARTTTGARIVVRTASPSVRFHFKLRPGDVDRASEYGIFINGTFVDQKRYNQKETPQVVEGINPTPGTPATFEIALPSWSNPIFTGLELPDDQSLLPPDPSSQKVYVALGDSITHGTGQGSASFRSYPFILAQNLDLSLYNMAVGGSQVSLPIAKEITNLKKIDLITILYGFNDWNSGKSPEEFGRELNEVIETIRSSHPETEIVCLRTIATDKTAPQNGAHTIEAFRDAVTKIVEERKATGDSHISLIAAEEFTTADDLLDGIHLKPKGAQKVGQQLSQLLAPKVGK